MCPACVANYLRAAALIASSTGGLAAVVVRNIRKVKENRDTSSNRIEGQVDCGPEGTSGEREGVYKGAR